MRRALLCWLAACVPAFAGLTFEQTVQELHVTPDAESATVDFTFSNTTSEPLKIDRYDSGCTCTNASLLGGKVFYKPGEKGTLRAVVDLKGLSGDVDKQMSIWLSGDTEAKPSSVLTIRTHIPVLLDVEPKTLSWDMNEANTPKTVTITVKGDDPIRISDVSEDPAKFTREFKVVEEGRKYELTLTPVSTAAATFGATRMTTDSSFKRFQTQLVYAFIRRPDAPTVGAPGETGTVPNRPGQNLPGRPGRKLPIFEGRR